MHKKCTGFDSRRIRIIEMGQPASMKRLPDSLDKFSMRLSRARTNSLNRSRTQNFHATALLGKIFVLWFQFVQRLQSRKACKPLWSSQRKSPIRVWATSGKPAAQPTVVYRLSLTHLLSGGLLLIRGFYSRMPFQWSSLFSWRIFSRHMIRWSLVPNTTSYSSVGLDFSNRKCH